MVSWCLIAQQGNLPPKSQPKHLLWTLCWLKGYHKTRTILALLRINSDKTFFKWKALFIDALVYIEVVSFGVVGQSKFVTTQRQIYFYCVLRFISPTSRPTVTD